jgi:hypothetical protein
MRRRSPSPVQLEYQFAAEAFRPLAALLQNECGAKIVRQLTDGLDETAYWDFEVEGQTLTLHYQVMVGTSLFNDRPEGRAVLEALRPLLDVGEHPIVKTIDDER